MNYKFLLDTNIFDKLVEDTEVLNELENNGGIKVFVCPVQIHEIESIPDKIKRSDILSIVDRVCYKLSGGEKLDINPESKHFKDNVIIHCAIEHKATLVTNDIGMKNYAEELSCSSINWKTFTNEIFRK